MPAHLPGRGGSQTSLDFSHCAFKPEPHAWVPQSCQHPSLQGGPHIASGDVPWVLPHTCLHVTSLTMELISIPTHIRERPGPGQGAPQGQAGRAGCGRAGVEHGW